jgi:hypothetical protein
MGVMVGQQQICDGMACDLGVSAYRFVVVGVSTYRFVGVARGESNLNPRYTVHRTPLGTA